jgi:SagB-type dehydrogenase family enzyme
MAARTLTLLRGAGGPGSEESCWQLFHENSKLGRTSPKRDMAVDRDPEEAAGSSAFIGSPAFELAAPDRLEVSLETVIGTPRPARIMRTGRIWRDTLATLLARGSGAGQESSAASDVDIWFHSTSIDGMPAGLYRLDRAAGRVRLIRGADLTGHIAAALLEPGLATRSALQLFVVADLAHLAMRHGERGYRYALVEAGRVVRDLDLVAAALGLMAVATGEFRDRDIDALLGLDGLASGTLFMVAVGKTGKSAERQDPIKLGSVQRGRRRRRRGRR